MRTTIPTIRVDLLHAFYWRADSPLCELYAADLQALSEIRSMHVVTAGLPPEATMRSIWSEALAWVPAPRRGQSVMLLIDGSSGRVLERWTCMDPWAILASRLRRVAA
jgi:hypothetical protein